MRTVRLATVIVVLAALCSAQNPEERTARYMESVRHQPGLLLAFLQRMPKGGDLHVHLSGAIYAESLIDWASENGLCVDRSTSSLKQDACDSCELHGSEPFVKCAHQDQLLYDQLVDVWSMRNWHRERESGHDHFFATFAKFGLAMDNHVGAALAEVATRAAADHLQYVELMNTFDGWRARDLGKQVGWDDDFGKFRDKLLLAGLPDIVKPVIEQLNSDEARKEKLLHCGMAEADPGCGVTLRYLYQVGRGNPPEQVFAQILLGFELSKADPRFVGFNLVMPEDYYVPMHDFDLHMRIIEALRKFYPTTHVSLHADELVMGLVPPEGLRFHIRESIERAGAERIGHGVAVMSERDPIGLLEEMVKKRVLVEICLTSNDAILGISGDRHPLPIYLKYGVPVALATDDEGVARSDMTHEYLRAVETYNLSYDELKRMARASLEHSFIPGESLWSDDRTGKRVAPCGNSQSASGHPAEQCGKFLEANEHARVQWQLEEAFVEFEKHY